MKYNKTLCLDSELIKKLEDINASELVNKLLQEYFTEEIEQNLALLRKNYSKNRQILKESRKKDKILRISITKLETKEKKTIAICSSFSKQQKNTLENCREFCLTWWNFNKEYFPGKNYSETKTTWEVLHGIF